MTNNKSQRTFKLYWLLLAVGFAVGSAILLPPALSLRLAAATLLATAAGWMLRSSFMRTDSLSKSSDSSHNDQPAQEFPLGKLFEATMDGMREGLVVVDQDMRVVASNRAAHQLFPLAGGTLNSQRLTELTRNAPVYNAFLDALRSGIERSGLKSGNAQS